MRLFNIVIILTTIWSSYFLYNAKYEARDDRIEIARLEKIIKKEREAIRVLKAEWSYLNRPEHLKILNNNLLKLQETHANQLGNANNIDDVIKNRIAFLRDIPDIGKKTISPDVKKMQSDKISNPYNEKYRNQLDDIFKNLNSKHNDNN